MKGEQWGEEYICFEGVRCSKCLVQYMERVLLFPFALTDLFIPITNEYIKVEGVCRLGLCVNGVESYKVVTFAVSYGLL